jgi:cell division protein FtsB
MARNRKYRTTAARFAPAVRAFLLCALIGGSGIGYVWQKNQIVKLGKQIKERELRLGQLRHNNEKLRKQLASLQSPPQIERRVRELNLGLGPSSPQQKLRLWEPVPDTQPTVAPGYGESSQYASRRPASPPIP